MKHWLVPPYLHGPRDLSDTLQTILALFLNVLNNLYNNLLKPLKKMYLKKIQFAKGLKIELNSYI